MAGSLLARIDGDSQRCAPDGVGRVFGAGRLRPPGEAHYYAFWTDTVRGFLPVFLFTVHPEDRVNAQLVLRKGRWMVFISDDQTGAWRRFWTAQDAADRFVIAEWLQEDIHGGTPPWAYPSLGPLRFFSLRVDGRPPAENSLFSQWMSVGRSYVAPSAPRADGFIINTVAPTGARLQYLRIATAQDIAITSLYRRVGLPGPTSLLRWYHRADRPIARILLRFESRLQSGTWPGEAGKPIHRLIDVTNTQIRLLHRGPDHIEGGLAAFRRSLESAGGQVSRLSTAIRRDFNLPEITPQR